jgi:hypothetical protein
VIATLVAPLVAQFKVVLEPEPMVSGVAVNELIAGLLAEFTVTVTVEVTDPVEFVAVNV